MKDNCMKNHLTALLAVLVVSMMVSTACGNGGHADPPSADPSSVEPSTPADDLPRKGEVLETMDAGGYTYVRVFRQGGEIWAAGPVTAVAVGDIVTLPEGTLMSGFHSKTLNRTFDAIYFVGSIDVMGGQAEPMTGMPGSGHGGATAAVSVEAGSIEKAEGGFTIAELYASREEISGKEVVVRGKVVKFMSGIMGRNWMHIQDGSGEDGSNDLTVTTQATAVLGDSVLVQGTAAVDKDFGAGYRYSLILEEATVTVE